MKYILYKTTNQVNGYIYIGIHKTSNPDVFDGYIGNGIYINKPHTYEHSKTAFQAAVKHFGVKNFKRETLTIFSSVEEALLAEALIVNEEFLARNDVYNMVLGGDFQEARCKKCYQYDNDGNYITEFISITAAANSINKTVNAVSRSIIFRNKCGTYYWSLRKLPKLDITSYIDVCLAKPVYRYTKDGQYDCAFNSITDAAAASNTYTVNVSRSAKLGYRVGDYQFLFIKASTYDVAKTQYIQQRPVYQYSADGKFLKGYESQILAEAANKGSDITRSVKNKRVCSNGFLWSLEELPEFCSTKTSKKAIGKYDLQGNLLTTYESVLACCRTEKVPRSYISIGKKYGEYIFKSI